MRTVRLCQNEHYYSRVRTYVPQSQQIIHSIFLPYRGARCTFSVLPQTLETLLSNRSYSTITDVVVDNDDKYDSTIQPSPSKATATTSKGDRSSRYTWSPRSLPLLDVADRFLSLSQCRRDYDAASAGADQGAVVAPPQSRRKAISIVEADSMKASAKAAA